MKSFLAGIVGGAVFISIIALVCIFSLNLHSYKVKVINPKIVESQNSDTAKTELINQLLDDGVILTPQDYTSNIASYYNTAITLLVFLFIIFSFIGYFHLKFISKEQIHKALEEKLKDSKSMQTLLEEAFIGVADDKYARLDILERIEELENELDKLKQANEPKDEQVIPKQNGSKRKKNS